jgi:ParB-like chromosome segregation protein Spo0J
MLDIALPDLYPHPANSNVMPTALFDKLVEHLRATDRYPPLIVRPRDDGADGFQIIDGHHRARALRAIGRTAARCLVWHVGADEALLLLATLNRLRGDDDPIKRGELLRQLRDSPLGKDLSALSRRLPEDLDKLRHRLQLAAAPPPPAPPAAIEDLPVAVHFFLPPADRRRLESHLKTLGGTRERALLSMLPDPPEDD